MMTGGLAGLHHYFRDRNKGYGRRRRRRSGRRRCGFHRRRGFRRRRGVSRSGRFSLGSVVSGPVVLLPMRPVLSFRMPMRSARVVCFIDRSFPGGRRCRLLGTCRGGVIRRREILRRCAYVCCVFVIACQISLTPRPVTAENGSGSAYCLMAFSPRCCSA